MDLQAPTNTLTFADAAKTGDIAAIIRLAEEGARLQDLSDATNIGLGTLRGMQAGSIKPSKNQSRKLKDAALNL